MDSEVIKEFLVKINYKTDETSFRRFNEGLGSVTKRVMGLAAAMAAAATAVTAGVVRMSRGMEDLYYSSQRLGSSVSSINAITYAASQMGTTAEEARDSLEGLAQRMRTNPGYGSLVQGLIGSGADLSNTTQVFERLAQRFRSMPYFQANQYAQSLGISEPVLQAMMRGLDRFGADYRRRLRLFGVDADEAARIGQRLQQSFRQTTNNFSILGDRIMTSLGPLVQKGFDDFNRWLERNHDKVVRFVEIILRGILRFGNALGELFTDDNMANLEGGLNRLIESMEGIVEWFEKGDNAVTTLKNGLGLFLVYITGTWAAGIIGAFTGVSTAIGGTFLGMLVSRLLLGGAAGVLIPSGGNNEAEDLRRSQEDPDAFRRRMEEEWARPGATGAAPGQPHTPTEPSIGPSPSTNPNEYLRQQWLEEDRQERELRETIERSGANNAEVLLNGLRRLFGFTPAAATTMNASPSGGAGMTGGETPIPQGSAEHRGRSNRMMSDLMRDFGLSHAQASGIVGNLDHESGLSAINERNPLIPGSRGGFGYAQWTGPRRRAFEAWVGGQPGMDINSYEANYGFLRHELNTHGRGAVNAVMGTNNPADAARAFYPFLSGGDPRAIAAWGSRLGRSSRAFGTFSAPDNTYLAPGGGSGGGAAGGVTVNQSTNITVNGAGNPAAVGQEVAGQQQRVNADLERNTRGAMR